VFEEVAGKANHRWWLWTFVGSDTVVFLIDPTRSGKVLERHLGIVIDAGFFGRRPAALRELGLLHRLPVARPARGGGPPVVLGAHPPLTSSAPPTPTAN
jgi:hypothetical protein